jgi:hypothetical protein
MKVLLNAARMVTQLAPAKTIGERIFCHLKSLCGDRRGEMKTDLVEIGVTNKAETYFEATKHSPAPFSGFF